MKKTGNQDCIQLSRGLQQGPCSVLPFFFEVCFPSVDAFKTQVYKFESKRIVFANGWIEEWCHSGSLPVIFEYVRTNV